jgi:hypothetical protein
MTQEALKIALDALETELSIDWGNQDEFNASAEKMYKAITAIKKALAQPEQEPKPATVFDDIDDDIPDICCQQYDTCLKPCTPRGVHLAQRTWVGLTDDEMQAVIDAQPLVSNINVYFKAIEAKLKEKNT